MDSASVMIAFIIILNIEIPLRFKQHGIQQMKKRNFIFGVMLVLSVAATHHAQGQDNAPEPVVDSIPADSALKILSRSTRFIEAAPAFSAKGDAGGELILKNGQLVEYGTTFTTIFVRPQKYFLRLSSRDGSESTMVFDGETITVASYVNGQHLYDTTPQRGDVNESLDQLSREAGSSRELAYFLTEQMTQTLVETLQSSFLLGKSTIDGILCDHLAIRSDTRDGQVWVERGDEPVPWRILITHRDKPGLPRFWVQFNEWNLEPEVADSTFSYTPPEGATKFDYFSE